MRGQPTSAAIDVSEEVHVTPRRNKRPARCYYCFILVLFLMLFLDSTVSLGTFGAVQAEVNNFWSPKNSCILFGSFVTYGCVDLPNIGSCAFVLWGLVSVTIVAFLWLIYSSVLFVLSPTV